MAGIVYAFIYGPLFAVVCCAYMPMLFGALGYFGMLVQKSTLGKLEISEKLGGIAEESFTAIKLISSFCQEEREIKKFSVWNDKARLISKK